MNSVDRRLLNQTLIALFSRAERYSEFHLENSFVDLAGVSSQLALPINQILYGRRGTGKTHAFKYQSFRKKQQGFMAVYIDLRTVGSNGGIYNDSKVSIPQRASTLIRDTLILIINEFLNYVIYKNPNESILEDFQEIYDELHQAINKIEIKGITNSEKSSEDITLNKDQESNKVISFNSKSGLAEKKIKFPSIKSLFDKIINLIDLNEIFVYLDEWSEIPLELQPYLSDLIRRTLFPIRQVAIKIAAIQYRSNFIIHNTDGSYIGLELGADIPTVIDLDELILFENNPDLSREFFSKFIFSHVTNLSYNNEILKKFKIKTYSDLISELFETNETFDELLNASEGNPRDTIRILQTTVGKANGYKIHVNHIREAARQSFSTTKEYNIRKKDEAYPFLKWIIKSVIKERGVRAFLYRSSEKNELIDFLYSNRVLHIIKSGIIDIDNPENRYKVYSIDYGCYIDLIMVDKAPKGLLSYKNERNKVKYIKVLENKYGPLVIDRAVLDPNKYKPATNNR